MGVEKTPPAFDFYFRAPASRFAAQQVLDLDGDGQAERVTLDSRRAKTLCIAHGSRLLWRGVQKRVRPWCLRTGDVDGDGRKEIALGTFKSTRLWPRVHRTLSFYAWDGQSARALWLGSRLSLPFREFHLLDVDKDASDELLAVERRSDGKWSLAIYNWDFFGFTLARRLGWWNSLQVLEVGPESIDIRCDGQVRRLPQKNAGSNTKPEPQPLSKSQAHTDTATASNQETTV